MNNNFDENSQFVRRPIQNQNNVNTGSAANKGGQVSENHQKNQRRPAMQQSRMANVAGSAPQRRENVSKRVNGAPRPATAKRNSPPRTAQPGVNRPGKEKIKLNSKKILIYVLSFFGMLLAMILIAFSALLATLHTSESTIKSNYKITYKTDDYAKSESCVTVNKISYLNMTTLSEMCNFTVSGSKSSLRFTADDSEYVEFTVGSVSANINGETVNMEGAALIRQNEMLWIPINFAKSHFNGIDISTDEETDEIEISRIALENGSYKKITFKIKGTSSIEGIDEDDDIGDIQTLGFLTDLSEYEKYMNPENRDDYLILVNKTNSIGQDYIPETLIPIVNTRTDRAKEQMVECAEKALEAMFIELYAAGYTDVSVTSGYRSYNKQVSLFNTYLQREMTNNPSLSEDEARAIVLTYSAFPGTSEHQTGLCCDMHNLSSASTAFAQKEAYKWLSENCYKFGFIIRYPEDKTDITGYSFEPWHYRFVGRYHAQKMYKLGMCLEEYVEYLDGVSENS